MERQLKPKQNQTALYDLLLEGIRQQVGQVLRKERGAFSEMFAYLSDQSGKLARARLMLICANSARIPATTNLVKLGAAVELLHLSTLLHDDVIDRSDLRRGKPCAYQVFGAKQSVLCGDYLFTKCFALVADLKGAHFEEYARALSAICKGELLQMQNNRNWSLSLRGYLKIISGKTAALFALSGAIGAHQGGFDDHIVKQLAIFCYRVGMIFQISDDCLDYQSNGLSQKDSFRDLLAGVVNLPLLFALQASPALRAQAEELRTLRHAKTLAKEVVACGGLQDAEQLLQRYREKNLKLLERLPDDVPKEALTALMDKAARRSV